MTRDELFAFFEERAEAWRRRDEDALATGHAESGSVVSPMFARVSGRAAIRESYRDLFDAFPDWEMRAEPPIVDGDRVAVVFSARATQQGEFMGLPGSGRPFEITGVLCARMDGGLIAEERRYYDFTGLLLQLGVLRGKPGRS